MRATEAGGTMASTGQVDDYEGSGWLASTSDVSSATSVYNMENGGKLWLPVSALDQNGS